MATENQPSLFNCPDAMLTFAPAAVRPPQKVNWEIPASAAEFLQPHTVALTFAAAAIRRISNFRRQKSCGGRMNFTAAVRRPQKKNWNLRILSAASATKLDLLHIASAV